MADQEPLETTSQDADQLPERIRVHALAKRLGVTSKRILAKLTELGADARSAQSNVDRAVAESVRDALVATEPETTAPAAEPAPPAPAAGEADAAEPEQAGQPSGLLFSAPEPLHTGLPTGADTPAQPTQLFTHAVQGEPHVAPPPPVFEAPSVAAPLFLSPDAAAAEEMRKRRRAERESKRTEESAAPEVVEEEPDTTEDEQDTAEHQGEADGQPRRRRRGRRGRGRGRGEQHADSDLEGDEGEQAESDTEDEGVETAEGAESAEPTDEGDTDTESDESVPEGASRRRRRRRRRKVGGEGGDAEPADDDPPNTVVHEREPRNKSRSRAVSDEVQGITGSTRLEAKRQRRRDGREAGRRRPPILTESEFLARREAVDRVMVVREKSFSEHPTATQVAVLEDNILVEHFVTNTGQASMVGNVYLGKVQNVLPSMEAAFVDIGRGRNGVLYAGEVNWEAAGLGGKERKIEQALKPGDQVLVQVSKDPVGHKGARLTTQISLAGRFLVYVPGGTSTGISRKLPDTERKRLKEILRDIVPADAGVIIRTASEGVSEAELARDVERLQTTWRSIEEQAKKDGGAPKTLYEEPDLLVKVIRDLFNEDFSRLVIEGDRAWSTVENYIRTVAPDLLARVSRHENNGVDVFETFRIDEQLAKALDRKVWLPSGGTLVIDRTEAMTVIDVNTGKFTGSGNSNLEETVTRNNLEAAEEIVRQMRLRDIGGMIVVDFIDMVLESNRDLVLRRLTEALGRDRTRHQVSEVTSLGLVQMTRKKLGTGLVEAFSTTCEHCHGRGILVHSYPVELAAAEETSTRREGGSRRRRGRDKGAAAAAATNGTPQPSESVEEAAVKRAHPVALAMAAHSATDAEPDEAEVAEVEVVATDADAVAANVADAVAAAQEALVEEAAEAETVTEEAAEAEPVVEFEAVEEPVVEVEEREAEPVVAVPVETGPAPVTEAEVPAAAEPVRKQPAVAEAAVAAADRSVANGEPEPRQTGRRRRVARSAAAPAADSAGAVFVLSSGDQDTAPAVDYSEPAPVELPQRARPRRRAVGRPAGPPVDSPN
ncbi:translation initiation factor IF-2 N-terminal domain-containing protein [Nocardia amikacinitolerans]|uniref:translation initiation factor IF-2 N-terminal domain-containing protein n=1 Tax=Nocardia amikacinitolerans TaxID=756689 RepID=UPI0020A33889|nr:translation initiation factor IF-2 N-terminal domain-containing protein [Nocardia amikacinitolerans]MCP2278571.1 ribonuclease E [Nocardia amikacinitolerans]